jgi:hypothetical protein
VAAMIKLRLPAPIQDLASVQALPGLAGLALDLKLVWSLLAREIRCTLSGQTLWMICTAGASEVLKSSRFTEISVLALPNI